MMRCPDGQPPLSGHCPGDPGFRQAVSSGLAATHTRLRERRAVGDAASDLKALPLPVALERYLVSGVPMSTWKRDLGSATAQVPRVVYGALAAVAFLVAAKSYRNWRHRPTGAR